MYKGDGVTADGGCGCGCEMVGGAVRHIVAAEEGSADASQGGSRRGSLHESHGAA